MNKSDDTISRQDAIDAFGLSEKTRKYGGDHSGYDTMMLYEIQDVLESLPSADAVEVVRCKDCMYRHEDECPMQFEEQFDIDEGDGYYDTNYIVHDYTQDDGYCSWGERMSND